MNSELTHRLSRTRSQISADLLDLEELYSALYTRCSPEQLMWRSTEGSWSVAECVDHVARSISHYLVPIRQAVAKGGPAAPDEDYLLVPAGWFSTAFLKRIGPQVATKFKAPRKIQPLSVKPGEVLGELQRGHAEAAKLLAESAGINLNRIRFRNPFIPVLRFTVATGFLILAAHGRRHLLQAQRVTETHGFPKSTAQSA